MLSRIWRGTGGKVYRKTAQWLRRASWSNFRRSLWPLVSFTYRSCCKVFFFTKEKFNNHIVEILRHKITCHLPPFPVCPNSATIVARTACLSTCWWSMEPADSKKYCKTYIWLPKDQLCHLLHHLQDKDQL